MRWEKGVSRKSQIKMAKTRAPGRNTVLDDFTSLLPNHLSVKIFIGFVKSTVPLRALAKPSLTCLVLLVMEMVKISAMSAICRWASARLVVPPQIAWSCVGSPADIRSCSEHPRIYKSVRLLMITYCFLLHLEQPGKPELCEELEQQVPEVLGQELADIVRQLCSRGRGGGAAQAQIAFKARTAFQVAVYRLKLQL